MTLVPPRLAFALIAAGVGMLAALAAWGAFAARQGSLSAAGGDSGAAEQAAAADYGKLPLAFEPNRGQADERVSFLSRGSGFGLYLTDRGPVLSLDRPRDSAAGRATTLRLGFTGADPHPEIAAERRLPGEVNYLRGDDPGRRQTHVPTFEAVRYKRLWPGIDALFYGRRGTLEYDFELRPGADVRRIGLDFSGARSLRLSRGGDLILALPGGGTLRQLAPVAYQRIGGERRSVESSYAIGTDDRVGIRLGRYERDLPLVIDPVLAYSTYLGGSNGDDSGSEIAIDGSGSAYVTGQTFSSDFPTQNALQPAYAGTRDAFVTKLSPDGSALVYSTYLGGGDSDSGSAIAIDGSGSAYVSGQTRSSNFPTQNALQPARAGRGDAFAAKLSPDGSALSYSTYLGGALNDGANAIAIDGSGSAYLTGETASSDFPTQNALQPAPAAPGHGFEPTDAFVAKLSPDGSALSYSTYLGGVGQFDLGTGIAVDGAGSAYLVGGTFSPDFPTTAGAFQTGYGGNADSFITKLSPDGSALSYSTYLGGGQTDNGSGIAIDGSGSAYVTGSTRSSDFPATPGAFQPAKARGHPGPRDAFATKLSPDGSALSYSTYLGGGQIDQGSGIAIDGSGSAYVTGSTSSSDFPTERPAQPWFGGDDGDAFLANLAPDGSALAYSTYLGGGDSDAGSAIATDGSGSAYVTGFTRSSDFPTTAGAFQTEFAGGEFFFHGDSFVTKIGADDPPGPICEGVTVTISGTPQADILVGTAGNDVIAGLGGNDVIAGLGGNDVICAGDGSDVIAGGDGNDVLLTGPSAGGLQTARGGNGDDRLLGADGADTLEGETGADYVSAGGANDKLTGGEGEDVLRGESGQDTLFGAGRADVISGGPGNDRANAGAGDDHLWGDEGDDHLDGDAQTDACDGGDGTDTQVECESSTNVP